MRFTQPVNNDQALPYNVLKVQGCADVTIGFNILQDEPQIGKRRYCNKVLVHECVSIPINDPLDLVRVDFLATSDPCYKFFEIFKSSEEIDYDLPTIELQFNEDYLVVGVLLKFSRTDTCCLPLRLAYRLHGYTPTDERILLSNGNLYITPCACTDQSDTNNIPNGGVFWTNVDW